MNTKTKIYAFDLRHPYFVELVGTAFLSLAVFLTGNYIFIGLALAISVYLGGPISGGCFNPAITIVSYMNNKLNQVHIAPYIAVQIIGAILGFFISKGILGLL